jgi:hypothetical protein
MAQSNIGLRFSVDTSQAKSQIEALGNTVGNLTEKLKEATDAGDWRSASNLSIALDHAKSAESKTVSLANQQNRAGQTTQQSVPASFIGSQAIATANTGAGMVSSLAGGNFAGAAISGVRGAGSMFQGVGRAAEKAGSAGMAKILGGLGIAGLVGGAVLAGGNALSEKYEEALPDIDKFQQYFGKDINHKSASINNLEGLNWYNRASDVSMGTGKTIAEMMEAAEAAGRYGIGDAETALNTARKDVMWERYTGADLTAIQNLSGTSRRYGADENAVSTAFAGLQASDMGKGQFDEFLNSMQRIMEDGITKGFVRGADEIAGNMSMLHKLSGGSQLWTGEQGANRLMNMSNAISNATNLQNVGDVISFGAASDILNSQDNNGRRTLLEGRDGKKGGVYTGTYVDTMQILERGVTADLLKNQFDAVNRLEGNNAAGAIERFRQMYNLNYTGAAQVWKMQQNMLENPSQFNATAQAEEIKKLQKDPEYQSDSVKLQNVLTKLESSLVSFGKSTFDIKIDGLGKVESLVETIARQMIENQRKSSIKDAANGLFDDYFLSPERKNIKEMQRGLTSGLRGSLEEQQATVNILGGLEDLNPMQRMYANRRNLLNTVDWGDPMKAWEQFQDIDFSVPAGREIYPQYKTKEYHGNNIKEGEIASTTLEMAGYQNKNRSDMGGKFAELVVSTINSNPELINIKEFTQGIADISATPFRLSAMDSAGIDSNEFNTLLGLFTQLIRGIEESKNITVNIDADL